MGNQTRVTTWPSLSIQYDSLKLHREQWPEAKAVLPFPDLSRSYSARSITTSKR